MTISESWQLCRFVTSPENTEIAANWLVENGCEGVQIEDTVLVFDQSEDATFEPMSEVRITGYRRAQSESLDSWAQNARRDLSFPFQISIEKLQSHDWATQWRENFPALEIGRFLITPSWESAQQTDKITLELDPGLAFGTGQHPTTRMCLELLGELDLNGKTLLDVGCGSGILSLAAAKLGARVVASDLDEWCVSATRENAAKNGVMLDVRLEADLGFVQKPFEVVVANLMSDLLIRLAPELKRVCEETLVVSGISAPRAGEVEAALNAVGFQTKISREIKGAKREEGQCELWSAFVFTV